MFILIRCICSLPLRRLALLLCRFGVLALRRFAASPLRRFAASPPRRLAVLPFAVFIKLYVYYILRSIYGYSYSLYCFSAASPLHRFAASPLRCFAASPHRRIAARPQGRVDFSPLWLYVILLYSTICLLRMFILIRCIVSLPLPLRWFAVSPLAVCRFD